MTRPLPRKYRGFYHVPKGTPYHVGNSRRGVRKAATLPSKAIDLDMHCTKDGMLICTHWPRPLVKDGFKKPHGARYRRTRRVWSLTWDQVAQWRAKRGYRVWKMVTLLREAARLGVRVELEAKTSPGLAKKAVWRKLAKEVKACGGNVQVKVLSTNPHAGAILKHAHGAGFTTFILPRGRVPRAWAPYIDYRRGSVRWKG